MERARIQESSYTTIMTHDAALAHHIARTRQKKAPENTRKGAGVAHGLRCDWSTHLKVNEAVERSIRQQLYKMFGARETGSDEMNMLFIGKEDAAAVSESASAPPLHEIFACSFKNALSAS